MDTYLSHCGKEGAKQLFSQYYISPSLFYATIMDLSYVIEFYYEARFASVSRQSNGPCSVIVAMKSCKN